MSFQLWKIPTEILMDEVIWLFGIFLKHLESEVYGNKYETRLTLSDGYKGAQCTIPCTFIDVINFPQ